MPAPPSTDQDEARLAAQQATGIDFFPGTELMKDINNVHLKRTGTETLVPHPSDDPADPVNWSRTWKWLTMSSMVLSTFNWVFSPLALGPQVPYYMESFNSTLPEVINFTGVSILVLGFTNLIWVPFARGFGRRPMAILTTMITTVSCIWRARATSYNSFLGAAILCGVGASPGETLGPVLIADVMLLHERGWWMGMYQWAFMGGLMIGPIIAGVTADLYGWQSFWWIATAISVFTNVWIIFFLPETKWDRRGLDASTVNAARLESPSINAGTEKMQVSNSEQSVVDAAHVEHSSDTPNENLDPSLSGRPNRLQFLPIAPWRAHESILNAIVLPFKLIRFPIVLWGACQFTCACSCYLMISITQSQALGAPPFNFTAAQVGYTNLGMFVGTSIALLTAGPLGDWMSRRATIRNNGVREPEMRLPALVPFAVCFLVGCVVVSVGFQNGWAWEVVVVVGFGLVGVQVAAISGIAINYVVDCYQPAAGEFLVGATVIKNVWGYGMSKFINNWIVEIGYVGPLMTITAMNAALLVFGALPLYFFGKRMRGWSAGSSVHRAG